MDKDTALTKAADAVAVFGVVVETYGIHSPEASKAKDAMRDSFHTARDHGATDDDLRAIPR